MKKLWGWVLFIVAWLEWYNLAIAPWKDEPLGWVILPYIIILISSLFGWYWLALHKEGYDAK